VGAAGLLLMTPRLRHRRGPALRGGTLPVASTALSLASHLALGLIVFYAASAWQARQPRMYVVNLVPAVAASGSAQGRPSLPPRASEPPPRTVARPDELPVRETPRSVTSAPEMPTRTPALPDRALPDRTLPSRAPGMPRPSDKELPAVASAAPPPPGATAGAGRPDAPAAALGRPGGSLQGAGAVTLTASDFPFAWYLAAVQRKITERWSPRAINGRQPVALIQIGRNGQVAKLDIDKTSGNGYYDQQALRAINEAVPFPPLPAEYDAPVLTIHLNFTFGPDRG